jgi:hypothetical protein
MSELVEKLEKLSVEFNDILFSELPKTEKNIETLKGMADRYPQKTGRLWDSTITYMIGDIVTFGITLYISKQNNNLGKSPSSTPDFWKPVVSEALERGQFYVTALATFNRSVGGSGAINLSKLKIVSAWNIDALIYGGATDGIYKVVISSNAGIIDTNYLIMISDPCFYGQSLFQKSVSVVSFINVIQKTKEYFLFKLPLLSARQEGLFQIAIVTQNQ